VLDAGQNPERVAIEKREPQPVLSIRQTVELASLTEAQGGSLRELWSSIQRRGVKPVGPPFVRYHSFGETETDLEVGIPVAEAAPGEGRIAAGQLPGGSAITTWHIGSHDGLGNAYGRLEAWLKDLGQEADGAVWEVYWWIDPDQEPDPSVWPAPSEWRTQLIQPIKPSPPPDTQPPRRGGDVSLPRNEVREEAREEARRHVRRKRILYTVVAIWLALSLMWFTIDLLDDSSSFWFYWPMLGTGIGVAITAIVLLGIGGLFGVDWERREIDKYLDRRE
jgi:effector-binding domain-containing protein